MLKATPPRLQRDLLARPRLLLGAGRFRDAPAVLVQAPGGYGKTSLLAQWRRECLGTGAIVAAVVIFAVRLLVETGETNFLDSWRGMLRRFWRVAAGSLLPYVGAFALVITVIGIPVAIYKFVCWQFVQQEILIGDKGIRDAFHADVAAWFASRSDVPHGTTEPETPHRAIDEMAMKRVEDGNKA